PTFSSCLLFQSSLVHRALHSFPTRRSSDLPPAATSAPLQERLPKKSSRKSTSSDGRTPRIRPIARPSSPEFECGPAPRREPGTRSEEHTSELQSRGHLVCRLLLEKKKTQPI